MTAIYGPFHRRKARTQSYETALLQVSSEQIWGHATVVGGAIPKVKAYMGPLCYGTARQIACHDGHGIEFETTSEPSGRAPTGMVFWHEDIGGPIHRIDDETIAIKATILKVYYPEEQTIYSEAE